MKRTAIIAMLLSLLLLIPTGCAGKNEAQKAALPEPQTPTAAAQVTQQPQSATPEPVWRYEVRKTTAADRYEDAGVLLASINYEFPELVPVCDGGDGNAKPPEDVQAVADAFNSGVWSYVLKLEDVRDLGQTALQQYNEMGPEYREYFTAYWGMTEVADPYERGDLLEVSMFGSTYWGGAHGAETIRNFHFDLKTGEFFELADLTDEPEKLHDMISEDIVNGIYDRSEEDWYFDSFYQTIREREEYNVSFGEDGVSVIFDEYEIAPYASGMPEFEIPYEKLARFLNERGRRILNLPIETRVLGDYYDASEMWYWFEGMASLDYDDTRMGTITNAYGTYEMPYLRFDEPGIGTMAELRARLAARFSPELIDERLADTTPAMFQEFDGVLYAAAAGRGTDWTVESVDYTVELNAGQTGGRILADVHRRDYNDDSGEWESTGVTEQVEFPFTLGDGGAIFSAFPTIW